MKNVVTSLLLLSGISSMFAVQDIISFLSHSKPITLHAFMDVLQLRGDERDEFNMYYRDTITTMCNIRVAKKHAQLQKLEQLGINSLEIRHPLWARELSGVLKKGHPLYSNARIFIIRYASLEVYHEQKARARNNNWAKVRGFFSQTKETVAGWFSSLRPKRKVV